LQIDKNDEAILYEEFQRTHAGGLITPASQDVPNVDFSSDGTARECRIWEGYLDASCLLLKTVVDEWPRANNLIFPALFNLRHAIEVALKWHIKYAGGTVPKRAGHDLRILMDTFCSVAAELDDEDSCIAPDNFLRCIGEIASLDPRGITFRYSSEHDGSPIRITSEVWDIRALYFAVSDFGVVLDDLSNRIERSWLKSDRKDRNLETSVSEDL